MKYKKIRSDLQREAESWKPAFQENLKTEPVTPAKGDEWYLEGTRTRKTKPAFKFAAYAAAVMVCFLAVFVSRTQLKQRVDAVVYLDVNPSVSLEVSKDEKVLRAEAHNADGEKILGGMKLKGSDIDVAVNALIGSMFKQGYLSEQQSTVLLSIESGNAQHAETLRKELAEEIDAYLTQLVGGASIYDQSIQEEETLSKLAQQYHITPGKAFLIQRLIDADLGFTYDELAGMNMAELAKFLHQHGHALKEYLNLHGIDLDDIDDLEDLAEELLEPEDEDDSDDDDSDEDPDDDSDDDSEDDDDDDLYEADDVDDVDDQYDDVDEPEEVYEQEDDDDDNDVDDDDHDDDRDDDEDDDDEDEDDEDDDD